MTLADLVKLLDTQVELRYPDANDLWYATVARCETKSHADSRIIGRSIGRGNLPAAALSNLAAELRGNLIVRDAMVAERRVELRVPEDLQA